MFNFPFPTDSLYKFCFIFGLSLIVFSMYFRNQQLNEFQNGSSYNNYLQASTSLKNNQEQYTNDSIELNSLLKKTIVLSNADIFKALSSFHNVRGLNARGYVKLNQLLLEIDTNRSTKENFKKLLENYENEVLKMSQDGIEASKKLLNQYRRNFLYDEINYYVLLAIGVLLFIPGIVLWYSKIQLPQDELLQNQLIESKLKIKDTPTFYRKRLEPKLYSKRAKN